MRTARHALPSALLAAAAVAFGGCSGDLLWAAELVDESLRPAVVRIDGRVLEGSCLSAEVLGEMELVEGEARALPEGAGEGELGLAAFALDDDDGIVAAGCVHVSVPGDSGTVVVPLRSGSGTGFCVVETCNLVDDDCDGLVDEGVDFRTDADNCGYCGRACTLDCEDGHCLEEAVEVGAGSGHTCVRRRSGQVFCWGNNSDGQIGDGTTYATRECEDMMSGDAARHCALGNSVRVRAESGGAMDGGLAPSVELSDVVDIDVGRDHACAVHDDGRVLCWGDGEHSRLGNGESTDRERAEPVIAIDGSALGGAVQVATGHWPSCARHGDGTVSCWGYVGRSVADDNGSGTVDVGDFVDVGLAARERAEPVPSLAGVTSLDVGYMHACAITGGQVICWGTNDFGELGDGTSGLAVARDVTGAPVVGITDAVDIGIGLRHGCAVLGDGTVRCWGRGSDGQLGDAIGHLICVGEDCSPTPVTVASLDDAVAVAAGNNHSCAVRSSGAVSCWGSNHTGELGNDTTVEARSPVGVVLETSEFVQAVGIAAGMNSAHPHTCAVMNFGTVLCWGSNVLRFTADDPPVASRWGRLGNVQAAETEADVSMIPIRVSGVP